MHRKKGIQFRKTQVIELSSYGNDKETECCTFCFPSNVGA
jgi:hypothetical protein